YVTGGTLALDNHFKKVADLGYDYSGNISSVNKSGNDVSSYIWDYNQELPVAKVTNGANVYGSPSNNPVATVNNAVYMSGTMYVTVNTNILVAATGSNGSLTINFSYNNQYISGNNSSVLSYRIEGITDPSYVYNGSLCAATMWASCSSGTNSATITGLTAG